MIPRILLALCLLLGCSSCSLYPFGHSKYGNYYGGQGNSSAPRSSVPKNVQRQEPLIAF